MLTTAGAVALVVGAARVGHSGGQLVYKYGAASAYATPDSARISSGEAAGTVERNHGGDDDER